MKMFPLFPLVFKITAHCQPDMLDTNCCAHTHTHTHACTHTHTYTHGHTHTHMHAHTHTHMHAHIHTCTHTHARTHTHMHAHTHVPYSDELLILVLHVVINRKCNDLFLSVCHESV